MMSEVWVGILRSSRRFH